MKYFAGAPEDHTGIVYDGIVGYANKTGIQTFGKEELKKIFNEVGLKYTKFYYPLPDYKLPNVIFSDEYLPNENSINDYNIYYYEGTKIQFDEKKAFSEAIKNGVFDLFSNSFFIEVSGKKIKTKINLNDVELIQVSENAKRFYEKSYN